MAKRTNRAEKVVAEGIDENTLKLAEQQNNERAAKALANNDAMLTLEIHGKSQSFNLVKLAAEEVETQSIVFCDNERDQSFLNKYSLSDLMIDLKENGQLYPAIGRRNQDGKIEIIDGSRRRQACLLAGLDFYIYVANGWIEDESASSISLSGNIQKPLSLIERGRQFQRSLDKKECENNSEIATKFDVHRSIVIAGLKAIAIDDKVIELFPSPSDLGKDIINYVHKALASIAPEDLDTLIDDVKELNATTLNIGNNFKPVILNKLVFSNFKEVASCYIEKTETPVQTLADGQTKAKFAISKRNAKIELKNMSDETHAQVVQLLNSLGLSL